MGLVKPDMAELYTLILAAKIKRNDALAAKLHPLWVFGL